MKRLFLKINNSFRIQLSICVVSMVFLFIAYFFLGIKLDRNIRIVDDDFSWVYQIDRIEIKDQTLQMDGWAFELGHNASKKAFDIILCDVATGERFYPQMGYSCREDVDLYFDCEFDYTQSGFSATINTSKLDVDSQIYQVLLKPNGVRKAYMTNVYYADGKVMYANPNEYVCPNVAGTVLEEIVQYGILRVYRPDYGMYVYQYENELYWIAEEWYAFENGDIIVQCQLDTTQVKRLPAFRLENNFSWDNISFWFTTNEVKGLDDLPYRAAKRKLPEEYAITKIWTGNHTTEWVWQENFRPVYEFE